MPIVGFCESGTWLACAEFGTSDICIDDDEIYRGFLRARIYQTLALYDVESLTTALRSIWGDTAFVLDAANGRVVMTPGRDLTAIEQAYLKLVPRVLPVALGITQRFHFGHTDFIAGFGDGWFGFCAETAADVPLITDDGMLLTTDDDLTLVADVINVGAEMMCQTDVRPYTC